MSNPFAQIAAPVEGIKDEKDSLGGSFIWDSGAYEVTVTMAYAGKASTGANSMNYEFKDADGRVLKDTEWVTSGTAKGEKNYYEKDGVKSYLMGYNIADALALLTTHKNLNALEFEEKMVKVYDKDAKGDVPTKVMVATEMLGKKVILGVLKQTENKTEFNETTKERDLLADTRDINIIDKIFDLESKRTIAEFRAKSDKAEFYEPWVAKNTGVTRNKVKAGGKVSGAKAGAPAGAAPKPTESLFN